MPHSTSRLAFPDSLAERFDRSLQRMGSARVATSLALVALAVYLASNPVHESPYAHYVWQADAWLQGRFEITWPVSEGSLRNDYYVDVLPIAGEPGLGQIPYPPLPAIVLLPAVAFAGLRTDAELIAALVGALNVALAWLVAGRVAARPSSALAATVFFGFGTVAWAAAARGSSWYLAHDIAMTATLLGVRAGLDGRGMRSAFLIGAAALARLTVVFGAPFAYFAGRGSPRMRALAAAAGLAAPLLFLFVYNLASTGQPMQPGYEELYRAEEPPIPGLYRPGEWLIVDPRYLPQNVVIMLLQPPVIALECDVLPIPRDCPTQATPTLVPSTLGMSVLLTSPGWLLALPALRRPRSGIVVGCGLAIASIALVDLMHFSQGWVQFGYRFSNDWAPFGVVLVALGIERVGLRRPAVALIVLSVLVNLWGVAWAGVFGW